MSKQPLKAREKVVRASRAKKPCGAPPSPATNIGDAIATAYDLGFKAGVQSGRRIEHFKASLERMKRDPNRLEGRKPEVVPAQWPPCIWPRRPQFGEDDTIPNPHFGWRITD